MRGWPSIVSLGTATVLCFTASPPVRGQGGPSSTASPKGLWYLAPDRSQYRVEPLGSTFRVSLVFAPVPGAGIVSYGVTLKFYAEAFDLSKPGIEIPAGLDHNGFAGPGALVDSGPGFVSVKGTVDLLGQAIVRYDAPLVVSVVLAPKDAHPGETSILTLEPYYTAGPAESPFVNGEGRVLDQDIVFDFSYLPAP